MKWIRIAGIGLMMSMLSTLVFADEGMWILKELTKQNLARMVELGFQVPADKLYSETNPCIANAVVIFGGGCTGITVSDEGLIFTNHHCGYSSIQKLSSVEHDYLQDGFVSNTRDEERPVDGLAVRYLKSTTDVSERINACLLNEKDEFRRLTMADSIGRVLCDSVGENEFQDAQVIPFYSNNKYYLITYDVYRDVRMVFAPPSSMGRFGGDTDNWMWPRHTIDFSVFRVYAGPDNKPATYSKDNKPYKPKYYAEVSLQGYNEKDYAMTIGFPGSTNRYLCSWGVEERIHSENEPRIEVRGIKQDIWKEAMQGSEAVRIKYASKYTGSSNYWKNSIGMNRGLARLDVITRKQAEEKVFADWVSQDASRKAKYGEVLDLLQKGYTSSGEYARALTYLMESFMSGAEIVRFASRIRSFDADSSTVDERNTFINATVRPFFKDYEPQLDQKVITAMLKIAKERVPAQYQPDIYKTIAKKYKGDYSRYVADLFKKTALVDSNKVIALLSDPKLNKTLKKDPAVVFGSSVMVSFMELQQLMATARNQIAKGERLYFQGKQEMTPDHYLCSDANFTMRMSYGSIGGYRPADATWYDYYSTQKGIEEKEDSTSDEFAVQPEVMKLFTDRNFGPYANAKGDLQVCFLSNNDITGGNSGSPVFDKNGYLIGLAFDGNWEAMSGDIAFEPDLQRTISVDIRAVLFMIDRWGKCPRLLDELKLMK